MDTSDVLNYNDEEFSKNYEPLPYTDYSLFKETYDLNQMNISLNPHSLKKKIFVPKEPIKIELTAERRANSHSIIVQSYKYFIKSLHFSHSLIIISQYK